MSSALEILRRDFGGDIIEPSEAEYESASRTVLARRSPSRASRDRRCPCEAADTASQASAPTTAAS
jgi:hypothetical protein